jgi:threonine/homoserine/homoserine lactone efflux protein
LVPGPAVIYIVARSVAHGRAAGLISVLGIHLGTIVHVSAAAIGLSALLMSSAIAFGLIEYLGAAYLIWIGVQTLLAKEQDTEGAIAPGALYIGRS